MKRFGSSSTSSSLHAFPDTPLCIVCQEAAVAEGPFSGLHLCHQHLAVDFSDLDKLVQSVNEQLEPQRDRGIALSFEEEHLVLQQKLEEMRHQFAELRRLFEEFQARVEEHFNSQLEAVHKCIDECSDIQEYDREVQEARGCGNLSLVRDLAVGMQAHVREIEAAFSRAARLRDENKEIEVDVELRLEKVRRMLSEELGGLRSAEIGVSAQPETCNAGVTTQPDRELTVVSHEQKLDGQVSWVAVCSDTSEFCSDSSGTVVRAYQGGLAIPQPCLVAIVNWKDHLTILPIDGKLRLRSYCADIDWKETIWGLHGDRQLLFFAQKLVVTVTDLSGCKIRQILPDPSVEFGNFRGICGDATTVFVSSSNRIGAFSKTTGELQTVIKLRRIPDAALLSLAIYKRYLLVTDLKRNQVHKVSIDTQEVVASHPTQRSGLACFERPAGVAVDSRGRMFVCECEGHTVRVVSADDGSLLWTLGVPGERGSDGNRLNWPRDLAVVTGGPCEQLVVADRDNKRLLVLNLP